jgi:hypothetical protein
MSTPINDDIYLTNLILERLKKILPNAEVTNLEGACVLVDGLQIDVENLKRMVKIEAARANEIIDNYFQQKLFLNGYDPSQDPDLARIMPRIHPVSIFNSFNKEQVAHVPFVNDTVMVFVQDLPNATISITTDQIAKLNIGVEEVKALALRNLEQCTPELEIKLVRGKEGRKAFISPSDDGYASSRLCLTDLWKTLSGHLGKKFYAAIPARDSFVAFSTGPEPFVKEMRAQISHAHQKLPYPITPKLFIVTESGISGPKEPNFS